MIEENHEKTPVRLVGTGIWTRDLPNASLVRYHGATSLGSFFLSFVLLRLFTIPQSSTCHHPPTGIYNPNSRGPNAYRGSNNLLTRILDRYTRAGLPECVVSSNVRASVGDHTGQNTKGTHPIPGQKLKLLTSPGIEPGPPGWKAGTLPTTPRRRIIL